MGVLVHMVLARRRTNQLPARTFSVRGSRTRLLPIRSVAEWLLAVAIALLGPPPRPTTVIGVLHEAEASSSQRTDAGTHEDWQGLQSTAAAPTNYGISTRTLALYYVTLLKHRLSNLVKAKLTSSRFLALITLLFSILRTSLADASLTPAVAMVSSATCVRPSEMCV